MSEVTETLWNTVRVDRTAGATERIEGRAKKELDRRAEEVREEFERRTGETRQELGARLFDLGEEYFPEEASRRRRQALSVGFVVGLATGFVGRHLLGR